MENQYVNNNNNNNHHLSQLSNNRHQMQSNKQSNYSNSVNDVVKEPFAKKQLTSEFNSASKIDNLNHSVPFSTVASATLTSSNSNKLKIKILSKGEFNLFFLNYIYRKNP